MNNEILSVKGLIKVYKRGSESVHALNNIDLSVKQGEFVSIVGPSGSGKSTLLYLLGLLDSPSGGEINIAGISTDGLGEKELVKLRRENIGFVFQQFLLLPTLTVRENIALPLMFNKKRSEEKKISGLIEFLGISHRTDHLPHQLSGGEMQRVSIGRALINNPRILMADEPTGNLDSTTADRIFQLLKKLNSTGIALVIVTHDLEMAAMADRVIKMRDGRLSLN